MEREAVRGRFLDHTALYIFDILLLFGVIKNACIRAIEARSPVDPNSSNVTVCIPKARKDTQQM